MRISDWSSDVCSSDLLPDSSRRNVFVRLHARTWAMHERGQPAIAGRQHRLDPFTQAARQYRRGAATGNRDEHWMSIDDRRRDEAAEFDIINDVDRNVRLLRGGGDGCVEHHIVSGRHHQSLASEQRSRELDRQMLSKDRKSVVWGTSVSVRVDIGGSRSIKKKK